MHARLADVGLVRPRESARLGEFLDGYVAMRIDVKPLTRRNLEAARSKLVKCFGANGELREITAGDADAWKTWLTTPGGSRTPNLRIRSPPLYPVELRARIIPRLEHLL